MKKIVLLQHYFNEIGGVETFLINFCKTFYKEYDITLVCREISVDNALLLSDYADIICEPDEKIECDICLITSVLIDVPCLELVKYKEIYQMIHSDWTAMKKFWEWEFVEYDPKTKYIAVSDIAKKSFKKEYNRDSVVIPNLVLIDRYETPSLRLLSCTRLTEEKGFDRMVKLCELFDKYEINYIWEVYGTNPNNLVPPKKMIIHEPLKQAYRIMKNYDYVIQLSDTESMCITMYESLMSGVPVIVTPFDNAVKEVKDGENGYILPFDMKLTKKNILDIANKIPKNVEYEQKGVVELWENTLK